MPTLAAAGNTEIPAYVLVCEKGYTVLRENAGTGEERWRAQRDGLDFVAGSPLELLGVVTLYESRGDSWACVGRGD